MGTKGGILAFLIIAGIGIVISYFLIKPDDVLPIYQPSDLKPVLVDADQRGKEDHRVSDFKLINQLGDTVTREDVGQKIVIADFFFARCQTICPVMNENMARLQDYFKGSDDIILLSHSVTPDYDTPEVLYEYGERYGADPSMWWLMTGEKTHIYELARRSYFAVLDEGDGGMQDFVHTENVVLVDREGRLRGFYDGTNLEEMNQLIADVGRLREERVGEE